MIENPMVTGLTARYAYLRWQMLDALLKDPRREVDCPAFCNKSRPAFYAALAAADDKHTEELFAILADAVRGEVQPNRTSFLFNSIAHAHAVLHAGVEK